MVNALTDGLNKPDQMDTGGITASEIGSGGIMAYNISGGQVTTGTIANNIAIAGTTGSVVIGNLTSSTGSLVVMVGNLSLSHNLSVLDTGSVVAGIIVPANGSLVFGAGTTLTTSTGSLVIGKDVELTHNAKALGSIVTSTNYTVPYAVAGSPSSTAGLIIQAGSTATDTGSDASIVFPLAFSTLPCSVVCQAVETEGTTLVVGATSTSGADIVSSAASENFNWIAIGPA
jgi:hypothetical protein